MAKPTESNLDFWKSQWSERSIGFHRDNRHPMLVKHHEKLFNGREKCKIFFPLCGKAIDMFWFASLGHEIIGVEGVQTAIEEFFTENKLEFSIRDVNDFKVYESNDKHIRLYLGDFFKFNNSYENSIQGVWDRGSLVAIAPDQRERYAEIMQSVLAPDCVYLLDTFDYNPDEYPGPPHFISEELINKLYGTKCEINDLDYEIAIMSERQKAMMTRFAERVFLLKYKGQN